VSADSAMSSGNGKSTIAAGSVIPARQLTAVSGEPVKIPDPARIVHLQFARFAGCPICNLHLRAFVRRSGEIASAGIREIVVFHSSDEQLRKYESDLPFTLIGDPGKRMYRQFGVEPALRALISPRMWPLWPRFIWNALRMALGPQHLIAPLKPAGGLAGLPADFLIAPDGTVIAAKYGQHAYDQWSVDDLLAHTPSTAINES
jgi:peroxiredoxin